MGEPPMPPTPDEKSLEELLESPVTELQGLSKAQADKLDEALSIRTIKDLATNHYFVMAQNLFLCSIAKATPGPSSEKKYPFIELISSITGAVVVLASLLYVTGWSYLYQYYKGFGVRVSELNVPLYDTMIYSLTVIFKNYLLTGGFFLLVIVFSALLSRKSTSERLLTPLGVCTSILVLLVLGAGLSHQGVMLGQEQAQKDMRENDDTLPFVAIKLQSEQSAAPAQSPSTQSGPNNQPSAAETTGTGVEGDFDTLSYKLLIHANGQYYFFRPLKKVNESNPGPLNVYVVPDSRVSRIRIQRGV